MSSMDFFLFKHVNGSMNSLIERKKRHNKCKTVLKSLRNVMGKKCCHVMLSSDILFSHTDAHRWILGIKQYG